MIAAGGDGTLIGVANGLVHSPVPLGILPLGTGNGLARALLIPLKLDEAMELLVNDHTVMEIDALQVGERHFFSNVSVGISPEMMKDTNSADKKLFGRLAYVLAMIKRSGVFQLQRYTLTLDGLPRSIRAAEVLISNPTLLEKPPFLFGPPETLDDGQTGGLRGHGAHPGRLRAAGLGPVPPTGPIGGEVIAPGRHAQRSH